MKRTYVIVKPWTKYCQLPLSLYDNLYLYRLLNQAVRIQVSKSVKTDIRKSRAAKEKRSTSGLIFPLLIEAKRATMTAAKAIEIGTFQLTELHPW